MNDNISGPIQEESNLDDYVQCALWSSTYEHEDCEDCREGQCNPSCDDGEHELSESSRAKMNVELAAFNQEVAALVESKGDGFEMPLSDEQIAHDFWLTREGHGTGFWDRGLGSLGDELTELAKAWGSGGYFYVGEDGKLHID